MATKENKKREDKREVVIKVDNISKTFRIPHEKHTSLKSAALNILDKKIYEEFTALKNVSLEIKKGEFFGIIGRNGSGKSTLLKILAGIYMPDKGKVDIKGKLSPFLELGVGFNPELTGRENLFLGGSILGLTRKEIAEKFDKIVDFSEIGEFIDMKMKNYSSGMQVRLAFALAINAHAEILLMDEVLAVGDSNFQSKCLAEFNRYKEKSKTVVLVTHDVSTVQRYCDRAMLLRNGKIVKIGNADEVANKYVYQNMSDEEKRVTKDEAQGKRDASLDGKNKKSKVVEILSVEFLDSNGIMKNVFGTGEALDIKIYFKVHQKVDILNFGVGLHSDFGGQVFGYNTQMDEYKIEKQSKYITLHFDEIPILKGEYFMNVACWGTIEQNHYDYKPKCKVLKMFSSGVKNKYRGLCDIKHEWKLG